MLMLRFMTLSDLSRSWLETRKLLRLPVVAGPSYELVHHTGEWFSTSRMLVATSKFTNCFTRFLDSPVGAARLPDGDFSPPLKAYTRSK